MASVRFPWCQGWHLSFSPVNLPWPHTVWLWVDTEYTRVGCIDRTVHVRRRGPARPAHLLFSFSYYCSKLPNNAPLVSASIAQSSSSQTVGPLCVPIQSPNSTWTFCLLFLLHKIQKWVCLELQNSLLAHDRKGKLVTAPKDLQSSPLSPSPNSSCLHCPLAHCTLLVPQSSGRPSFPYTWAFAHSSLSFWKVCSSTSRLFILPESVCASPLQRRSHPSSVHFLIYSHHLSLFHFIVHFFLCLFPSLQ